MNFTLLSQLALKVLLANKQINGVCLTHFFTPKVKVNIRSDNWKERNFSFRCNSYRRADDFYLPLYLTSLLAVQDLSVSGTFTMSSALAASFLWHIIAITFPLLL